MPNASKIGLTEGDAPGTPGSGISRLYPKTDHLWYTKDSAGTERELYSAGGTDIPVADGGTGASTLTDHGVLVGSGTSAVTALSVGTNGQVLVGSTGADPVFATITDGEGIDTALGAGTLTIACETASDTNPGVVELATNAEALTGTDTTRAVTPDDIKYVLDRRNLNLQNLLSNTDWIVASGSTLVEAISGAAPVTDGDNAALTAANTLLSNGGFDSATTGWAAESSTLASVAGGKTGNCLEITRTADSSQDAYQDVTTVVGKLYYASTYVKSGTSGDEAYGLYARDIGGTNPYTGFGIGTSSGAWVQNGVVFKAGQTTTRIYVQKNTSTAGTMLFDSVTLYEVTPGYVAADTLAFDGWVKDNNSGTLKVYREHQGTNTQYGSFYSMKGVSTAGSAHGNRILQMLDSYKYQGATVTFAVDVMSSVANSITLEVYGGAYTTSVSNNGTGFEHLEVTATLGTGVTHFVAINFTQAATAYFSKPMLVFGSYIGVGNYAPRRGEIVYLENHTISALLNGVSGFSDTALTDLIIESDFNGKIGKGIKAVLLRLGGNDSGSAGADCYIYTFNGSVYGPIASPGGRANDFKDRVTGWQLCNSSGNIQYAIEASGSGTFDVSDFQILAVELR